MLSVSIKHLDPKVVLILRSGALSIKSEIEQTAIFLWQFYVPLRPKVLADRCYLPGQRFEKGNREANHDVL